MSAGGAADTKLSEQPGESETADSPSERASDAGAELAEQTGADITGEKLSEQPGAKSAEEELSKRTGSEVANEELSERAGGAAADVNLSAQPGTPSARAVIVLGDNLEVLPTLPDGGFSLIYIDPPFNTGTTQKRAQLRTVRDEDGDRTGFKGQRYRTIKLGERRYADVFDDYLEFLWPRLEHARRLLAEDGSFFLHLDYREVHYAKVACDQIFGRESFMNEIVWAYDYGGRSKSRWSAKHDNILWYARDPARYVFEYDAIDRIPYMAPGLVGPEKAARGKTPTDVWWQTIVSPQGREKTGYPTQKPLKILERIVAVHSRPGDTLLDFFAGSGSFGEAALRHGRSVVLVDQNPEAVEVMRKRLAFASPRVEAIAPAAAAQPVEATLPVGAAALE